MSSEITARRVTRSHVGIALFDGDTLIHDCLTAEEAQFLLTGTTERASSKTRIMPSLPYDAMYQDRERRWNRDRQARPWLEAEDEQ